MKVGLFITMLLLFASVDQPIAQHQSLIIVHEGPDTVSAQPYYRKFEEKQRQLNAALANTRLPAITKRTLADAVTDKYYFPVVTTSMRPGVPFTKRIPKLLQPIFLIGMDHRSLKWMRDNFAQLKAMGATGVVVDAPHYERFAQLRANAAGLGMELSALRGDGLARMYGVRSYPVLLVGVRR